MIHLRSHLFHLLTAFLWLFCLCASTCASPLVKRTTCFDDLPDNSLVHITKLCDFQTAAALSCTSQKGNDLCTRYVKEIYEVGNTPAFIPAVKRCFAKDSLDCYLEVRKYFEGQIHKRHLKQLPALAAQLGAVKIFQHLKNEFHLGRGDSSWNEWMTRAALRQQWTFVKTIYNPSDFPSDIVPSSQDEREKSMWLYHIHPLAVGAYTAHSTPSFQSLSLNPSGLPDSLQQCSWIDTSFVMEQEKILPKIEDIWNALDMSDSDKNKIESIENLGQKIKEILKDGIYLMDDILPSSELIISFWLNHYKGYNAASPNNAFLRFLLDEGAPIHDSALILMPSFMIKRDKSESFLKNMREMAIRYTSGSGTVALANQLLYNSRMDHLSRHNFIEIYVNVAHANILDTLVLRQLVPYLTQFPNDMETLDYFIGHGLKRKHVLKMYKDLRNLSREKRKLYRQTVDSLWFRVTGLDKTWVGYFLGYRSKFFRK